MAHILKSLLNRLSAFLANILNLKLNVEIKELETELRCRRRSYWLLIHALPWECWFPATSEALKELFICCRDKSGRFSRVAPVSWDLPPPFFANRVDSLFFHLKTREFKFLTFLGEGWWWGGVYVEKSQTQYYILSEGPVAKLASETLLLQRRVLPSSCPWMWHSKIFLEDGAEDLKYPQ